MNARIPDSTDRTASSLPPPPLPLSLLFDSSSTSNSLEFICSPCREILDLSSSLDSSLIDRSDPESSSVAPKQLVAWPFRRTRVPIFLHRSAERFPDVHPVYRCIAVRLYTPAGMCAHRCAGSFLKDPIDASVNERPSSIKQIVKNASALDTNCADRARARARIAARFLARDFRDSPSILRCMVHPTSSPTKQALFVTCAKGVSPGWSRSKIIFTGRSTSAPDLSSRQTRRTRANSRRETVIRVHSIVMVDYRSWHIYLRICLH